MRIGKLPVYEVVCEAISNVWLRRTSLSKALVLGAGLIIGLSIFQQAVLTSYIFSLTGTVALVLGFCILQLAAWALLAVSCHRVLLDDVEQPTMFDTIRPGRRQIRYMMRASLVGLPTFVFSFLYWGFFIPFVWRNVEPIQDWKIGQFVTNWLFALPFHYFVSRWSLVLPAISLGRTFSFADSWALTKGNGWRITATILAVPFCYGIFWQILQAIGLQFRHVPTFVWSLAAILVGVATIASLSYAYRWFLEKDREPA